MSDEWWVECCFKGICLGHGDIKYWRFATYEAIKFPRLFRSYRCDERCYRFLKRWRSEFDNFSIREKIIQEWSHCPEGIRSTKVQEYYTYDFFYSFTRPGPDIWAPLRFLCAITEILRIRCCPKHRTKGLNAEETQWRHLVKLIPIQLSICGYLSVINFASFNEKRFAIQLSCRFIVFMRYSAPS